LKVQVITEAMAYQGSSPDHMKDDNTLEEYILLVLSDSNLPTGGFVASSGLESYWAHGLLQTLGSQWSKNGTSTSSEQLVAFISASLDTYGHLIAGFLQDVHRIVYDYMHSTAQDSSSSLNHVANTVEKLDIALHSMMLNHVAQRASKAQGVALLTLYAKSFAPLSNGENLIDTNDRISSHGHLPICWAAFMAALGVHSSEKALAVHMFLQARAILSSAVRLNIVGPYLSHRLLAFEVKQIIQRSMIKVKNCTSGLLVKQDTKGDPPLSKFNVNFDWHWQDDGQWTENKIHSDNHPKTTWPLGDLLQARHDQLHSRLFNS
jgi:urease accessory protein